eukprot:CAMPEP_0201282670 /NCGR_PEP_ID=MMETSP1317-20130820/6345_1 /ASSEMBLY_ACC=CAM_ASM_000770 /TAXON_ID=187299 /ORGANISM="Undescribed Undescribed, Strain Undescribed" /LENGTH=70 /DNA_ID=CAMNT_0047596163 /DNA_START=187 /DNA_END=399 /DNA_ORIENTATION=-
MAWRMVCDTVGIIYPAYLSFKAIESKESEDDVQWLTYWVLFSCLHVIDGFSDILFFWLPAYDICKLIFVV